MPDEKDASVVVLDRVAIRSASGVPATADWGFHRYILCRFGSHSLLGLERLISPASNPNLVNTIPLGQENENASNPWDNPPEPSQGSGNVTSRDRPATTSER